MSEERPFRTPEGVMDHPVSEAAANRQIMGDPTTAPTDDGDVIIRGTE